MISPVDRESKLPRGDVISIPHVCFCRPGTFFNKSCGSVFIITKLNKLMRFGVVKNMIHIRY